MSEQELLKLLEMVAARVTVTQVKHPMDVLGNFDEEWSRSTSMAFMEVKELLESLQYKPGSCIGPFSEELPEDHSEVPWGWRVFGCKNHVHVIHLKYGYIVLRRELAEKILALGMP